LLDIYGKDSKKMPYCWSVYLFFRF